MTPSPRMKVLWFGLVGLIALAIGFAGGVWWTLPNHPGDNSAEAGFARDMSTHHGQAVEMAMLEYRNGGDGDLQSIAYDIATTQQAQIGIMDGWLSQWDLSATGDHEPMAWVPNGAHMLEKDGRMPGMATRAELETMKTLSGTELDIMFCKLMIKHHVGGIHMVDAVLDESDNDEVRSLAEQMKKAQQLEVDLMERKLRELEGAAPA